MKIFSFLLEQIISDEIFQLLLENRIEFIQQTYPKKLVKQLRWRQQNSPLNRAETSMLGGLEDFNSAASKLIELFFDSDPTTSKEYTQWMIKRFLANEFRVEDIASKLEPYLETFHDLKQRNIIRGVDINQLSASQMMDVVDQNRDKTSGRQDKIEAGNEFVESGSAEIVYNSKNFKVIIPKTEEASCYFGQGTRWCTAASRNNMFSHYSKDGSLYIIIDRNENAKYQFHFETSQFMDASDDDINIADFLLARPELQKVFKDKIQVKKFPNGDFMVKTRGIVEWFDKNRNRHREGGPAAIWATGTKEWFLNGKRHRVDGPAVERATGTKEWFLNGKRHRVDGPAIEEPSGHKEWYLNGNRHREDGPAYEGSNGSKEWWVNGELHREDGPAAIGADGGKEWWLNGELHREGGPAIIEADGTKEWRINGHFHREGGPAFEGADGSKEWWLNGEYFPSEKRWLEALKNKILDKKK